jgi:hypothetical protein
MTTYHLPTKRPSDYVDLDMGMLQHIDGWQSREDRDRRDTASWDHMQLVRCEHLVNTLNGKGINTMDVQHIPEALLEAVARYYDSFGFTHHPVTIGDLQPPAAVDEMLTMILALVLGQAQAKWRMARDIDNLVDWANNCADQARERTDTHEGCKAGKREFLQALGVKPLSSEYEVTLNAYQTVTVEADDEDDAFEQAQNVASDNGDWEIDTSNYDINEA